MSGSTDEILPVYTYKHRASRRKTSYKVILMIYGMGASFTIYSCCKNIKTTGYIATNFIILVPRK